MGMEPLPEDWQRGLVIAAHPDDIEYGTAAAVARWTGQGKEIAYVLATSGEAGIAGLAPAECGPLRQVEELRSAWSYPDLHCGRTSLQRFADSSRTSSSPCITGLTWGSGVLNSADHRAVGISALDAASDAGNEWIFPELRDEGLEPWSPRWVAVANTTPSYAVDVTATFEHAVDSLSEHKRYLEALDSAPAEEQARGVLDMVAGRIDGFDAEHAVGFELFTFRG